MIGDEKDKSSIKSKVAFNDCNNRLVENFQMEL
jgi:hypothetical protein